jgi:anti-sigma regulatory factor (Ser/Thr protein kinase)
VKTVIRRELNRIVFEGGFFIDDLLGPIACIHQARNAGFDEIILDFGACTAAFAPQVVALCVQVMRLRSTGLDFQVVLPEKPDLARLFRNANWAHLLDPVNNPESEFRGFTQVPATHFTTDIEQRQAVNRIVNAILGAIPDLDRRELAALEWSINEITDNVLVHSRSPIGGLIEVSTFQRAKKSIEYIVADAGVGIPATLRPSHPELTSDAEALENAIREGVTRDVNIGQGNGLYGSYQVCSHSMGSFHLESGRGKLMFSERVGLRVTTERVPFEGTLVVARITFSDPQLLAEALRFGGKQHIPMDFVELVYEQHPREEVRFVMRTESSSFGSRIAGTPMRNKLSNLVNMCPGQRIIVDFADVPLVSSSFADEVFGKLFIALGPMTFTQRFEFCNVALTVQQLIDKAITQRASKQQI